MKITVLGSGTSTGVPVVGCSCQVCQSKNPKNNRTRSSILVEEGNLAFLVDTSTELRIQLLREGVSKIDGVFYTHSHADHLHGIDDLRPLSYKAELPLYGSPELLKEIDERFPYIFGKTVQKGGGKPKLFPREITGPVKMKNLIITPIPLFHGIIPIYGFRFNDFVYITDCSRIPPSSLPLVNNCRYMIIGGLRYKAHETHFSIDEAVDIIKKTGPERAWLTHICHDVDHDILSGELPPGIEPAYDGMTIKY